jgi:hypothetical protein
MNVKEILCKSRHRFGFVYNRLLLRRAKRQLKRDGSYRKSAEKMTEKLGFFGGHQMQLELIGDGRGLLLAFKMILDPSGGDGLGAFKWEA